MGKARKHWWDANQGERYWCEITDRKIEEIGHDLYCPQTNFKGKPFWSYSLIQDVRPGDVVFHYHSKKRAIIGASLATNQITELPISWAPHWSGKKVKRTKQELAAAAAPRPGWKRLLTKYRALAVPLTLSTIQESDKFIRTEIALLSKQSRPRVFLQMYPKKLRALQGGYVTKMPLVFVSHWEQLASLASELTAGVSLPDSAAVEAVVSDLMEQVEIKGQGGQGFIVDPICRTAIERHAVECAKTYFFDAGFVEIEEHGKPFDLLCRGKNGETLYVEVKGTTTAGDVIILTANEIAHTDNNADCKALFVLANIVVERESDLVKVSGGSKFVRWPWKIDHSLLHSLVSKYELA